MKNSIKTALCPLCQTTSDIISQKENKAYFLCPNCKGIFLSKELLLDSQLEKERYMTHNNDVNDPGYHKFVSPIVNAVLNDFLPEHKGLDFGAGTGPVISKLLTDRNYQIKQYDPFFFNLPELLQKKYDYIVCCEVIEHFYDPDKEFQLLKSLLKEKGKLYCMTKIYREEIDFENWYYKNDNTHVFFYQPETFNYIQKKHQFFNVKIINNLIIFSS